MTSHQPLIPYIAIALNDGNFTIVNSFCSDDEGNGLGGGRYEHYARYKFKSVDMTNRMTLIKSQLGHWYVKGCQQDLIYIVATSPSYPMDIASECLDELYELHQQAMGKFRPQKRKQAEDSCCMTIAIKYGTLDESSAAHVLMTEIEPEVRSQYSKSIRNLMDEADEIKEEMNNNILALLNQVEKIERLEALSADLEQHALVFKKRAKKLKWSTSWDNSVFLGTAVVTLAGGIVGFLAGGPGGAAVLTPMTSVAAAEATETIVLAVAAGAGYLGAQSAMKSWFATQTFIPV